jgi:thioredoxin 1
MIYWIRIMAIILFVSTVGLGCSGESQDKPAGLKATGQDPAKVVSAENAKQDRPLVTFVELGSVKCIPCKMMQPIMEEIEKEYAGQVDVVFHDVWTEAGQPYARQYGIRAIPTQIFLDSEGKEYSRHEGFFPKEELVKVLKQKGVQ